ncbi:MAG TPA: hypothetical protein VD861_19610, partial [Pyrinomonadaceae bacterium]|nr:hypothetical protein [Pyrinomonadaceae bacterium]
FAPGSPLRVWVVRPSEEARHLLPAPADGGGAAFAGLLEKRPARRTARRRSKRLPATGSGRGLCLSL